MANSTLATYRQTAAPLCGLYVAGTSSATANNTQVQLECTASSKFKSTINSAQLYVDKWLFVPTASVAADKVRRVATYTPANGYLTPDDPWSVAQPSKAFEIHGLVEPLTDMTNFVNQVLKQTMVVVEFTVTPTPSDTRHSLASAASWLSNPAWVYQVGWLGSGETRSRTNPFQNRVVRGWAEDDGGTVYLNTQRTFASTETIYVKAIKPAYHHCSAFGGSLGSQSGLSAETDFASVDPVWVAWGVKLAVLNDLDLLSAAQEGKALQAERAKASANFNHLTRDHFHPPTRTFKPLLVGGPGGTRARAGYH